MASNHPIQADQDELQQLKQKYLARVDALDQEEELFKQHITLLERLLLRVSHAVDNQDTLLKNQLNSLRDFIKRNSKELKREATVRALEDRLENIDASIIHLDERRSETHTQWIEQFSLLINDLENICNSREQKRTLRTVSKLLNDQCAEFADSPSLLMELTRLLHQALHDQLNDEDNNKNREHSNSTSSAKNLGNISFLKRFIPKSLSQGGRSNTNDALHQDENLQEVSLKNRNDASLPETTPHRDDQNVYRNEDNPNAQNAPETPDNCDKNSDKNSDQLSLESKQTEQIQQQNPSDINPILNAIEPRLINLLEQLSLPEHNLTVAKILRKKVEKGLSVKELGPTVDDIVNLVIAAIRKGQDDFECFLQRVEEQVEKLLTFLEHSQTAHDDRNESEEQLNLEIKGHLESISGDVQAATDLRQLKSSIQDNLDSIVRSMSDFFTRESERNNPLVKELNETRSKMENLECELQEVREQVLIERHKALTDPLTKLPNRSAYVERLELEYSRWERYQNPTSLAIADIDFFKKINDSYGHIAGDRVIKTIAKTLFESLRKTDFIARIGGEEFVILLPETPLEQAMTAMDKARKNIEKLQFHFRQTPITITMSFGVTTFCKDVEKEAFFDIADQALYQAKESGRNQVRSLPS